MRRRAPHPRPWPPRWRDEDGAVGTPEARRAGALLDLPPPEPLGAAARVRIEARLAGVRARSGHASLRRTLVWASAAALIATATVAAAGGLLRRSSWWWWSAPGTVDGTGVTPHHGRPAGGPPVLPSGPASGRPPAAVAPMTPRVLPGSRPSLAIMDDGRRPATTARESARDPRPDRPVRVPVPAALESPTTARLPVAPPPESAPSSGGPAAPADPSEARLVADALARLRASHDPEGSLALLADHDRRFPDGALAAEARVARIEAWLALGRRTEALKVLDDLDLVRFPHGAEFAVTRAELRAGAGRCREAAHDFGPCADGGTAACRPEAAERALFGRASCRSILGEEGAARADLAAYLAAFPEGRFAGAARTALGLKEAPRGGRSEP